MNQRQVFDKIKRHLLKQNKKSQKKTTCLYRGPNGLKCAIGCLIKTGYSDRLEYQLVTTDAVRSALEKNGVVCNSRTLAMLTSLQDLHDHASPALWAEGLDAIERGCFSR